MKLSNLFVPMLGLIIQNISPELKAEIREGVLRLETKAQQTKNPFDDLGVMFLKAMLSD
jgi:hypothetical protein